MKGEKNEEGDPQGLEQGREKGRADAEVEEQIVGGKKGTDALFATRFGRVKK